MGIVEAPSAWQDYWQGYWLGAVLAGSVCVVALTLFFVWSLAAAVLASAIMFLALVAMLAILDLAPALGMMHAVKLRDHINVFIALHATFAVLAALLSTAISTKPSGPATLSAKAKAMKELKRKPICALAACKRASMRRPSHGQCGKE